MADRRWGCTVVATPLEEILRSLALQEETVVNDVAPPATDEDGGLRLDPKVQSLVRLGALIALDAPVVSYQTAVVDALSAGAVPEEVVGALLTVAPLVGTARVTSATPAISIGLGYDLEAAFERLDRADHWSARPA